jgi:RND family efflux transporter MFP subunit
MGGKKKWWVGGATVVAMLGMAAAVGLSKPADKDKSPDPALEFAPNEVVQPVAATIARRIEFSGALVAPRTAIVRAKAGGTLLALTVAEGSRVAAGQVLATIDGTEMAARVNERVALLEAARAARVQADRAHASNQRLADQHFISTTALDQSLAALDTARANERAAQAQLETVRALSRDTRISAPIAGIVAKRHAVAGEKVAPEQPLVTIVDLTRLELAGLAGTHEVSQLAPGMPAVLQIEGVDEPVAGRIARIAPAAEPGTRSIGVTIELGNPDERYRAGQYALARVEVADGKARLTVPASALGNAAGQDHVWLIENGVLARRAVTIGRRDEHRGQVEVLAGIGPESQVLAARFDNLREGGKAVVVAPKAPPMASAAASTPLVK